MKKILLILTILISPQLYSSSLDCRALILPYGESEVGAPESLDLKFRKEFKKGENTLLKKEIKHKTLGLIKFNAIVNDDTLFQMVISQADHDTMVGFKNLKGEPILKEKQIFLMKSGFKIFLFCTYHR